MLAVLALWAVIAWRLGPELYVNAMLVGIGLVASAFCIWWTYATQKFAERNPAQAMLDGAQFIEYKRFEAEAKGQLSAPSALIEDPGSPTLLSASKSGGDVDG